MEKVLRGLYSGFLATGPMTILMMAAHQLLPRKEKSPLPPATLSFQIWKRLTGKDLTPRVQSLLTMGAHFVYGSTAGILYSKIFESRKMSVPSKGFLFGLTFWAANYLGLTPALGLRAAGTRMPIRRNLMMLAAHAVWGSMLAFSEDLLNRSGSQMLVGEKKALTAE